MQPVRIALDYSDELPEHVSADLLVLPALRGPGGPQIAGPDLAAAYAQARFSGEEGEDLLLPRGTVDGIAAGAVLLAGVGERSRLTLDTVRRTARRVGRRHGRFETVATTLPQLLGEHPIEAVLATVQGLCDGAYHFDRYRSRRSEDTGFGPTRALLLGSPEWDAHPIREGLAQAEVIESAVAWARDLVNTPACDLTPVVLADAAQTMARRCGLSVRVWLPDELADGRFGGVLGVAAGSRNEPRLIEVRYDGPHATGSHPSPPEGPVIGLAGKGVTFDAGGLALKTVKDMLEMKSDMAGAAAVLAAMQVLALLQPPGVRAIAVVPAVENLPGCNAIRPGDVLRHRNGATTEVVDPDCEGRLILADALAYLVEQQATGIIDAATLTYSTIAALGLDITAAVGNDAALIDAVRAAGDATGEPIWELPLWRGYRSQLDSDIADLRNEGRDDVAGAIVAALFLDSFVGSTPWVHLDIGGTAYREKDSDETVAGGTGVLVRALARLLTSPVVRALPATVPATGGPLRRRVP
jgi:leucyl aminopeptidase